MSSPHDLALRLKFPRSPLELALSARGTTGPQRDCFDIARLRHFQRLLAKAFRNPEQQSREANQLEGCDADMHGLRANQWPGPGAVSDHLAIRNQVITPIAKA